MTADLRTFLSRVARANLVLVAVVAAATHLAAGPGPILWGCLAGGLLGAANFEALRWLGGRIVRAEPRTRAFYAVLFAFKLAVLASLVVLLLSTLPLDGLGFVLGISTVLPAILLVQLRHALAPATPAGDTP